MKSRFKCPSCETILEFDRALVSTVKCPKCGHLVNEAKLQDYVNIKCPHCSQNLMVLNSEAKNDFLCFNVKCKKIIEPTKPFVPEFDNLYRIGKLELLKDDDGNWLSDDKTVILKRGENTIGKKATSSASSIQLPTSDPYMSRNHAKIEVVMKPDATFVHRFSDMGSLNGSFHNDQKLEKDDVIVLTHGDTIKLGHTCLRFVQEYQA